jgi:hypothetical protein
MGKVLWVNRVVVSSGIEAKKLVVTLREHGFEAYVAEPSLYGKTAVEFWSTERDVDLDFLRPRWLPKRPLPKAAKR